MSYRISPCNENNELGAIVTLSGLYNAGNKCVAIFTSRQINEGLSERGDTCPVGLRKYQIFSPATQSHCPLNVFVKDPVNLIEQ